MSLGEALVFNPAIQPISLPKANDDWHAMLLDIIKKYEGMHLKAYCDRLVMVGKKYLPDCSPAGSRWSIGYGTKSFPGETITAEEAERRLLAHIDGIDFGDMSCYTTGEKAAIYDFAYNAGPNAKHSNGTPFRTYVERCDKESIKQFLYPGHYKQKGLQKRRQAEWNAWHSQ